MPTPIRLFLASTASICALSALSAGGALAKGVTQVAVCGAQGCKDATAAAGRDTGLAFPMGRVIDPPVVSAPFVRVVVGIGEPGQAADGTNSLVMARSSYLYVPSLQLFRAPRRSASGRLSAPAWQRAGGTLVSGLSDVLGGVARFPARRLNSIGPSPAVELPRPDAGEERGVTALSPSRVEQQGSPAGNGGTDAGWWAGGFAVLALLGLAAAVRHRRSGSSAAPAT